jgi:hypothetical protein
MLICCLVSAATMYGPFEQDSGDIKVYFFGLRDGDGAFLNCVLFFEEECKWTFLSMEFEIDMIQV